MLRPGLSDNELAHELAAADLFVLATQTRSGRGSVGEGFGLVLLEAQAAGTPVIAPAYGGSHEAYVEGVTGMAPTDESVEAPDQDPARTAQGSGPTGLDGQPCRRVGPAGIRPGTLCPSRRPEAAVTNHVAADATGKWRRELISVLRHRRIGRQVAGTAGCNVASAAAAGLGGIIVARALGPELRGEYAAVTAWFGVALIVGSMGQPAALCFYVAHDPGNARGYVATSRAMMLATGTAALAGGILAAPLLAQGDGGLAVAYRIAFAASIVAFVGASYTFSLQARNLRWWNTVRVSQPVLSLACLAALWRLRLLTLTTAVIVLAVTMVLQLGWAYYRCRSAGLAPGRAQARLVRPLAGYGTSQMAAVTPAVLNAQLDQLVLSQAVPPATLGMYAIAVSCTLLPVPMVSAIGNVAFPRLAARYHLDDTTRRMQWLGIAEQCLRRSGFSGAAGPGGSLAPAAGLRSRVRRRGAAAVDPGSGRRVHGLQPGHGGHAAGQETTARRGPRRRAGRRVHGGPAGGPAAGRWRLRRGDSVHGGLRRRARHDAAVPAEAGSRRVLESRHRRHARPDTPAQAG